MEERIKIAMEQGWVCEIVIIAKTKVQLETGLDNILQQIERGETLTNRKNLKLYQIDDLTGLEGCMRELKSVDTSKIQRYDMDEEDLI